MSSRLHFLAAFAAAASLAALGAAMVAEYGFGLRPCVLCLAQRVPFAAAAALGLLALFPAVGAAARRWLVTAAGLLFLINGGIAVYHVGVEHHWWESPGCSGASAPVTTRNLAAAMSRPAEVSCDKPAWQWHGLTMAALNILYSGGLAAVVLLLVRRREISQ